MFKVLNLDYYPRESHLVTFRDPWSFPILYHPACSNLVPKHIADLSQKVRRTLMSSLCRHSHPSDCSYLRVTRRISRHPLLPAQQSRADSRSSYPLFPHRRGCPARARYLCTVPSRLSSTLSTAACRPVHCRPVNGPSRPLHTRVHIPGHGS
jgi:hypothetical protein